MATIPSAGTPALNAITATKSSVVNVENYGNVSVQLTSAGISSGNGVMTILGSNDGVNFYGIAFVDMASTTTTTAITSKTLNSNTTFIGYVPFTGFKYLKVTVTVTTDGNYTVWLAGNINR